MADELNRLNESRVTELTTELRGMGLAVAVFMPGDVPEQIDNPHTWLVENRKYIEDAMVEAGNRAIELFA